MSAEPSPSAVRELVDDLAREVSTETLRCWIATIEAEAEALSTEGALVRAALAKQIGEPLALPAFQPARHRVRPLARRRRRR